MRMCSVPKRCSFLKDLCQTDPISETCTSMTWFYFRCCTCPGYVICETVLGQPVQSGCIVNWQCLSAQTRVTPVSKLNSGACTRRDLRVSGVPHAPPYNFDVRHSAGSPPGRNAWFPPTNPWRVELCPQFQERSALLFRCRLHVCQEIAHTSTHSRPRCTLG